MKMKSPPLNKEESQKLDTSFSIPHLHFKHILGGSPLSQALRTINYYCYYYYYYYHHHHPFILLLLQL